MNTLILYLRTVFLRKSTASFLRKNAASAGFSILEMTIVLGIMAATSIAGIKVLNGKIEQNAVDRVVADLTLVAESAYECYVAGECKAGGGWKPISGTAPAYLDSFLPQNLRVENYTVHVEDRSELVIQAVNLPNKRIAQRVAHIFGSLARQVGQENKVKVTLGIPGTENAFSGLKAEIKREMKMEDFIFTSIGRNIEGVDYVIAKRIKLGGAHGVDLTQVHVGILINLAALDCDGFLYRNRSVGKFECRTPLNQKP